ncbi:MAG: bacteriohemerythrin [Bacteroidales bacterium]|nr:bacteriohemerythrin [Bacteroidales bacterium]
MEIIKWTPEYSVGIASIDSQHQSLFNAVNEFYNGIKQNLSREATLELLEKLKAYTVYHFKTEEQLMKTYSFPGYQSHKDEHDNFKAKVADIENRIKNGKLVISIEITNMLKQWIENHIHKTDKAYSAFLISKGVK